MINPLAISTRGRIGNSSKQTLTLATRGLIYLEEIIVPPTQPDDTPKAYGGGSYSPSYERKVISKLQKKTARKDDQDIVYIIKAFLKCQQ